MITYRVFLMGLLVSSTVTGLVTEAIKNILSECGKSYKSNLLAGIVALFVSDGLAVGYTVLMGIVWTRQIVVIAVALVLCSWLCSMLGYDKVVQAISQFKQD
ncbi:MAG: aminopeptidase [Oscillospiraceae bacterium]|nr:aminopeptidase [Oscillospiraceae bacterium]